LRYALVTGATSGIGRATAVALARSGFHVIAAGRNQQKVESLASSIHDSGGSASGLVFDLASLAEVRRGAAEVRDSVGTLDVLVNNAGIGMAAGMSRDGFEIHWGVNHLGPFLLTKELGSVLGAGSRVVTVASEWHRRARDLRLDRVRSRSWAPFGLRYYATTKTANILFTSELARRRLDLRCHAVHPGLVDTGIFPFWVRPFLGTGLRTPEQGADTVVWCATSDEVSGESGLYYADRTPRAPSPLAADPDLAAELWERSEAWVN
jgi:NAD(P)-dependent dehydrogenase (short-subunit alcohol dehydrogenase family)